LLLNTSALWVLQGRSYAPWFALKIILLQTGPRLKPLFCQFQKMWGIN